LKTLAALSVMIVLCACHKQIDIVDIKMSGKQLAFEEFVSMLSKDKTYIVSAYYTNNQQLSVPNVNSDDTYTFDGSVNDGWVTSLEPCIEYHYNFKAFKSDDSIMFEWVNFQISPQTFIVADYEPGEWFLLKAGDTYTKYKLN
jgi:hypothetical protein